MLPSIRASSSDQQQTSGNTLRKYCRITELTLSDTHSAQSIGHVSFTGFQVELNISALYLTLATGTGSYHLHPLSKYARNCCILWSNFSLFHTHLHPSDSLDSWLWQHGRAGGRSFRCEYPTLSRPAWHLSVHVRSLALFPSVCWRSRGGRGPISSWLGNQFNTFGRCWKLSSKLCRLRNPLAAHPSPSHSMNSHALLIEWD